MSGPAGDKTQGGGQSTPSWAAVKAVLGEALDLEGAARLAYLDKACDGNPALRKRVDQMLAADAGDGHTLNPDAGKIASVLREELAAGTLDAVGRRIGRYTVERLIGRGGMGAVYDARDESLNRRVALKVVGAAFAAEDVLRRFAHESRVLARLQHPGIAHVYESGIHHEPGAGSPTPYFAMELVEDGTPVTSYVADRALSIEARLGLMARVCDAVHHGHQRGVIHRDLKPGNILVDKAGNPKVIDFGIARVMDSDVAATARTRDGQIVGTLNYMSPEQCRADNDQIDTRSDVYALGVVLYEVLTGRTPYQARTQSQNTPAGSNLVAILRAIESEPAVKPSRWDSRLRGDIETIVLKALEKEPENRYQSAAELASDVQRVLARQPITARPRSAAYELSLFVRRNRALVGAASLVFLALVGGVIGTSVGLERARHAQADAEKQAQRATRIATFFKRAFRSADPTMLPASTYAAMTPELYTLELTVNPDAQWGRAQKAGEQTTVKDVLRFAADHLHDEFRDDPVLEAELRLAVGEILTSLNDLVGGSPQIVRGIEGMAASLPADDPRLMRARWLLGHAYLANPTPETARPLLEPALEVARRTLGPIDPFTVLIRRDLALCLMFERKAQDAVTLQQGLIDELAASKGADSAVVWNERSLMTMILRAAGRKADALQNARECVAAMDRLIGADTGPTIFCRRELFRCLSQDPASATEAFEVISRALDSARVFYGKDHPAVGDLCGYKLQLATRRRDLDAAEQLARELLTYSRRVFGPDSDSIGRVETSLARILVWKGGHAEEALQLADHAIRLGRETLKLPPHEDFLNYHIAVRAGALRLLGRSEEAVAELNTSLHDRHAALGDSTVYWVDTIIYAELALNQLALGHIEEATAAMGRAEAIAAATSDRTYPSVLYVADMRVLFDAELAKRRADGSQEPR